VDGTCGAKGLSEGQNASYQFVGIGRYALHERGVEAWNNAEWLKPSTTPTTADEAVGPIVPPCWVMRQHMVVRVGTKEDKGVPLFLSSVTRSSEENLRVARHSEYLRIVAVDLCNSYVMCCMLAV